MEVLVAGGTGFIGTALAAHLVEAGHGVHVLARSPERLAPPPEGITYAPWDGRSEGEWISVLERCGAVVNLAGAPIAGKRWTPQVRKALLESRLGPTALLVRAAEKARKGGVWVQGSAVGWYGSGLDDAVLDEASPPGSDFLAGVCRRWEAAAAPVEAAGIRLATVRLGVVLEKDGGALPRMARPFDLFAGGPVGSGDQWISWIHRLDVLRALTFILSNETAAGAFNLTSPGPVTMAAFAKALSRALGRPSWLPVPSVALRLVFGEGADVLLKGQRVVPQKLLSLGFRFLHPDLEAALRAIYGR